MAVMGSGDVIGRNQSIPEPRRLDMNVQTDETGGPPRAARPRQQQMCGAMTQQGDGNRASSQPQEFVRLVGYRDPKVRPPRAPG
jgi:hypothetical protein